MKTKRILIAVICVLSIAVVCLTTSLVLNHINRPIELTGKDKLAYDFVSVASYSFKSPSSVRVVSGTVVGEGDKAQALLRLSATNGFGATTTGYYWIYNGGKTCTDLEEMDSAFQFMFDDCELLDELNISLINKASVCRQKALCIHKRVHSAKNMVK